MSASRPASVGTLAAIGVGLALASSCFPLLATTVASLGPWTPAAVLASGGVAWLVSRVYGELAALAPSAAGVRTWVGLAYGPGRGTWLALLSVFLVIALGASECTILAAVLHEAFPALPPLAVGLGLVALATGVNVAGFEPTGRAQAWLTGGLLAGLGAVAALALGASPSPAATALAAAGPGRAPGLDALTTGLAGAIFLFVGFEWLVTSAEEADPTGRALPRALGLSVVTLAVTFVALALAFGRALDPRALAQGSTPHLALGAAVAGRPGLLLVAALSTVATVSSFTGGILGASRLVYALAREGALPRRLATLDPRTLTPRTAILAVSALTAASAALLGATRAVRVPILAGAAIECLVYAGAALAFAKLRHESPERPRPYRAPFGPTAARGLAAASLVLSVACVAGAGEWAGATGATVALAGTAAAAGAWRARRLRSRPRARRPLVEVTRGS